MTRGRRAAILAGLALLLGGLAATDVGRRERALAAQLGPTVPVLGLRSSVEAGTTLAPGVLAVRRVPARYAPPGAFSSPTEVAGRRTAVRVVAGTDLVEAVLDDGRGGAASAAGAPVRRGERVAQLVAGGDPSLVVPGARVDVLITRPDGGGAGASELALEDAEVLRAAAAPTSEGAAAAAEGPQLAVSLRTTLRQAMELAAAQDLERRIRLLPRAAGDDATGDAGLRVPG